MPQGDGYKDDYIFMADLGRDDIYSALAEVDPEGIARRDSQKNRKIQEAVVPGPDFIWCVDGHDKLSDFGIQIYAACDAYSRHIIWMYVGISNRTVYSCTHQFLQAGRRLGRLPMMIRSDRGGETGGIAELQYAAARVSDPECTLNECYHYTTSKMNQRIESFWSKLESGCLVWYRVKSLSPLAMVTKMLTFSSGVFHWAPQRAAF